jgi:syntaxin-binding protein 5
MNVYTVSHSRAGFAVEDPITVNKVIVDPLREATFVINSKSGSICRADKTHFAEIVRFGGGEGQPVIFITAGAKSVRSYSNITGERVGRADWSSRYGKVIAVQVVERLGKFVYIFLAVGVLTIVTGSRVFVAYTDKSALHIYSLPHLEHILTIPALSTPLR